MHLVPQDTHFPFLGHRRKAFAFSILLLLVAMGSLLTKGLNFGIDFTGGTLVEVGYSQEISVAEVREDLHATGIDRVIVQTFGAPEDILVRVPTTQGRDSATVSNEVLEALRTGAPEGVSVEMRRVEFVGPQVGEELTQQGLMALLYALIGILIYVAWRFELRFAVGSVAALLHDVLITLGVFSLTGLEFDLPVVAAVLAVIGYSLNDTIVVFDRIRENLRKMRKAGTEEVMNASVNQTLARTVVTSSTTLLVLLSLFFLGGPVIHGFATALITGVLIGTYSSVFVGAPLALVLGVTRSDMMSRKPSEEPEAGEVHGP
ncbi:preprotein translocase subunit SecF [Thiohalorhabdus denitrificans]|uniref:Protein-export membrane protein SecF n=1 Tax=Thiohalorhabdus denitrificans TaxID=381306 RepID=A0A0P9ENZ6_9GAMM|nr:protein translocase subunit SecF [Thiohalorhabdus denitrificans]KPV40209.1 preprotein translocase subunit SecF [Thiohalorhabdus denitrificans]SCX84443.1 protein translocase subunit secF [Thiohalorhabdus denitrificans]